MTRSQERMLRPEDRQALRRIWNGMRQRCRNPNCNNFYRYGGRGITVCARWDSFDNFAADMGARPTPKHQIERIDNDAGYSPENCKWATAAEQRQNQAYMQFVLHEGTPIGMGEYRQIAGLTTKQIFAGFADGSIPECCKRGHLFTPDNLTVYHGQRWCKTCRRASEMRSWEKRKPTEAEYKRAYKARLRAQNKGADL